MKKKSVKSNVTKKPNKIITIISLIVALLVLFSALVGLGFRQGNKTKEINELKAEITALKSDLKSGDKKLENSYKADDNEIKSDISELENSIVWYQHDVRLTIKVESTETGGSATAIGYCTISLINNNPNAYDCIDVGNGNNALVSDLATIGSKNTSGYCLIDYRTYEGGKGRRLMYLFQNMTVFNDPTENSAYAGDHLYVFVYSVYSEGDFATPNVQSQLIPNIVISYDPDGNPVYNGGRFILTDTDGIKTATINDNVTKISVN